MNRGRPKGSTKKSVRKASTRPGDAKPVEEREGGYVCSCCGKVYKKQKGNFPASQSTLFRGNGAYMTICNNCLEMLFEHYRSVLGSEEEAMKRLCMKLDIYWHPEAYRMVNRINTTNSRMKSYISKTYMIKFIGRTYDDTLDEQTGNLSVIEAEQALTDAEDGEEATVDDSFISPEAVIFWGSGFTADAYKELDMRYERWTKDIPKPLPQAEEALYKQICLQESQINRNMAAGKDIEKGQTVLNSLLGSLNMKPSQQKEVDSDKELDSTPLGVWARRWEEDRPIPDDEIKENTIIKYITTWFYGHLGRAFNLKNVFSQMYDDAMNKLRVTRPEFENEDDDNILVDLFGDDTGGDSP